MDWLEKHQVILNFFENTFTCLNKEGEIITVIGIPRRISVRQISSLHMKKIVRKGYKLFAVQNINNEQFNKKYKPGFEDIPILQEFADVFLE